MLKKISLVLFALVCFSGIAHADYPKFIDHEGKVRVSQMRPFMIALIHDKKTVKIGGEVYKIGLYKDAKRWLSKTDDKIRKLKKLYRKHKNSRKKLNKFVRGLAMQYSIYQIEEKTNCMKYEIVFWTYKKKKAVRHAVHFSLRLKK